MSAWDDRPIMNDRPNKRLLLHDDDSASEDDYVRQSPRRGALIPPSRPGPGLIEEEPEREALGNTGATKWPLGADYQPSWPYTDQGKSARRMFQRNQAIKARSAAAANPWTRTGQQTRDRVREMFGEPTAKNEGIGGWFRKLFGVKPGNFRAQKRADYIAENPTVKDRWNARRGAGKLSWMERLFGARKNTGGGLKAMGITSTNAPKGVSSGWADQLIEASKAGRLDEDNDKKDALESGSASPKEIVDEGQFEEEQPDNRVTKPYFFGNESNGKKQSIESEHDDDDDDDDELDDMQKIQNQMFADFMKGQLRNQKANLIEED